MLLVLNMLLTSLSIVSLFLNTILLYEKREIFTILRMFISALWIVWFFTNR